MKTLVKEGFAMIVAPVVYIALGFFAGVASTFAFIWTSASSRVEKKDGDK